MISRNYLLGWIVLFPVTGATLDGRDAHDVLPGGLPGLLHDPRERAILPRRFGPDLLQHFLGKIETLLSLVAGGHARQRTPPWAAREFATPAPYGARVLVTSQLTSHLITSFPPFNGVSLSLTTRLPTNRSGRPGIGVNCT